MRFLFRLFLLSLSGGLAFAQAPKDYVGPVTTTISQMTSNFAPLFLGEAQTLLRSVAVITLVILGIKIARASVNAHTLIVPLDEIIHFGFLYGLAETLLKFWSTPTLILGGYSVSNIIPDTAYYLAGKISLVALNTMTGAVDNILNSTSPPSNPLAIPQVLAYWEFTGLLMMMEGLLFVLSILGFVAIGIGTLIGPLTAPFLLTPRFEWLFYNWVSFTIKYSFYQVIANAIVFIWANAFNYVMANWFGGTFTLAQGSRAVLAFALITAGILGSVFFATLWCNDLFTGSSHAGGSFSSSVRSGVTKASNALNTAIKSAVTKGKA